MTIRTLDDCLRVFRDDPTMFERTYAIFFFGEGRQRWKSSESKSVNSVTPPRAPFKQQLDTEPDKYKRITSRKIIVIVFLLSVLLLLLLLLLLLAVLLYLNCIDWVPKCGWIVVWWCLIVIRILFPLLRPILSKEKKIISKKENQIVMMLVEINISIYFFVILHTSSLDGDFSLSRSLLRFRALCPFVNWQLNS